MKKITARNTKSEIIAAYNALSKELRAAKAKSKTPAQKALPASSDHPPTKATVTPELSIGSIIESLRGLTDHIGESASTLQGELTAEATTLEQIRSEADTVVADLAALHSIEVTEQSLAELIERYATSNEAAANKLTATREKFEAEMATARDAWAAEQKDHARKTKEAAHDRKQLRARDVAEHDYEMAQRQATEADERAQQHKSFEQQLVDLREQATARWTEREASISERETERKELEDKATAFETQRAAAVKKAEGEGTGIAKRQAKGQIELKKKDNESTERVLELQTVALGETIAKQEAQIEQLSRQLEDARKQTTELAVKAIDGASNASSFEAVKEIALEQAKNTQKGK